MKKRLISLVLCFAMFLSVMPQTALFAGAARFAEDGFAYVIDARQWFNTETNMWYMHVMLITEDGYLETDSVDEVSYNGEKFIGSKVGGKIPGIEPGSVIEYSLNMDGYYPVIDEISNYNGVGSAADIVSSGANMSDAGMVADGWYAVQIGMVEEGKIGFFPNSHMQNNASEAGWADMMLVIDKDKNSFGSTAIDDISYIATNAIGTIGYADNFSSGFYNAIIMVEGGCVCHVFSFLDKSSGSVELPIEPAGEPTIEVGKVEAYPGETVEIPITISNNTGVTGIELDMSYSDNLIINDIVKGDAFTDMEFTRSSSLSRNPIKLMWDALYDDGGNGVMATIYATVPEEAVAGEEYGISMAVETIYDEDYNELDFVITDGGVTVKEYLKGDINGDGKVNTRDVTALRRYLAGGFEDTNTVIKALVDVNEDGRENTRDVAALRAQIVG